jgi:hypothetical protein
MYTINNAIRHSLHVLFALAFLLNGLTVANAETVDGNAPTATDIPIESQPLLDTVISWYRDRCRELAPEGEPDHLTISDNPTYEMIIDDAGTKATVLYTDFSCGELGPTWCGTGGCDTYIFVDGKAFAWFHSFAPYTFQIPNPYDEPTRTAVMFPLHGGYCKSAKGENAYGAFGCYEIAVWDEQKKTFFTRSGALPEFDPSGP